MKTKTLNEYERLFFEAEGGCDSEHAAFMLWCDEHRHEIRAAVLRSVVAESRVKYVHGLISDWWKPETTSQALHRDYALESLGSILPNAD